MNADDCFCCSHIRATPRNTPNKSTVPAGSHAKRAKSLKYNTFRDLVRFVFAGNETETQKNAPFRNGTFLNLLNLIP